MHACTAVRPTWVVFGWRQVVITLICSVIDRSYLWWYFMLSIRMYEKLSRANNIVCGLKRIQTQSPRPHALLYTIIHRYMDTAVWYYSILHETHTAFGFLPIQSPIHLSHMSESNICSSCVSVTLGNERTALHARWPPMQHACSTRAATERPNEWTTLIAACIAIRPPLITHSPADIFENANVPAAKNDEDADADVKGWLVYRVSWLMSASCVYTHLQWQDDAICSFHETRPGWRSINIPCIHTKQKQLWVAMTTASRMRRVADVTLLSVFYDKCIIVIKLWHLFSW